MRPLCDNGWRAILNGPEREEALGVVREIATALRHATLPPRFNAGDSTQRQAENASLAEGKAGLAILYGYLSSSQSGVADHTTAVEFLDQAADAVSAVRMSPSLYGGFTGVAWAMAHLDNRVARDDANASIDEALIEFLGQSPWRHAYDLVSGLVGLGVYALERLPRVSAIECLSRVIDRLDQTAERRADGICWFTKPDLLFPHQRRRYPIGYYNLGVAHGAPGVIALLGGACAAGVAREKARALLDGVMRWLEMQSLPTGAASVFPTVIGEGIEPTSSSLAWCYGDPGVAAALLLAARCVNEPAWERRALDLALHAGARSKTETKVVDAGLCHGAAGLGHLFNRIFQATGEEQLANAARFWFRRSLDLRRPGKGIAGYSAWGLGEDGTMTWLDEPGLLTGAAGVALALLAAATPVEPGWDRVFLLSIRPAASPALGSLDGI